MQPQGCAEGVKSGVHFHPPASETPDNPEILVFFRIIEGFWIRPKKQTSDLESALKNTLVKTKICFFAV